MICTIIINTDEPAALLQAGDVVDHHGSRGVVTGVDLADNDRELGPMFVIELEGGEEIRARSCACRVLVPSPARGMLP